ncbi:UvrD-helicase domain-containing protein [Patescibacteria group bacterium]|nr:UvrD-helicase domain-containing protein [Patescibacteria group bacterium]
MQVTEQETILKNLNDRQVQAVTAGLGPVLILAGAGSGKTKVLTHRIAHLISENLFKPDNILALTFTNKAAKEMQQRVQDIFPHLGMPTMGTFHSVCARILRQEIHNLGYTKSFVIFDDDDQQKLLKEILSEKGVSTKFSPSLFRTYISSAKNMLQTPDEMNLNIDKNLLNLARSVYAEYQNYLYKQNAVDFDDLLMLTVKLLENFPEILRKYQDKFRYILVDEYQDTNQAQYILLYLLSVGTDGNKGSRNLFVVGDDAQSIYGFRGSNLRNILNFEEHFPDALVIKLEQNYRSSKNILAVAQEVIQINTEQKPKTLWTENAAGSKIMLCEVEDELEEAKLVAKTIIKKTSGKESADSSLSYETYEDGSYDYAADPYEKKPHSILDIFLSKQKNRRSALVGFGVPFLPDKHGPLKNFAVLYRTHAQSRALEEVFLQAQIPYQIVGGVKFYQRKEIKDVLAYLRLVLNHRDLVSLKRVINEPARGIGEKSYLQLKNLLMSNDKDLSDFRVDLAEIKLSQKQYNAAQDFFRLLEEFTQFDPAEHLLSLMRLVLKKTGYEKWLRDGSEEGETRWENIEELFNVAAKYQAEGWQQGLSEFLEEVALMTEIDNARDNKDAVTLMSLHSAKGLEFDTVFLIGLEEGILPHSRSLLNPEELSEEIRLAYVGITRARKDLYLIYAQQRRLFGQMQAFPPSRILKALPEDYVVFKNVSRFG